MVPQGKASTPLMGLKLSHEGRFTMPKITIYERDNTGNLPVEDLAVVFIPGTEELLTGVADSYGCAYIPSSTTNLAKFFSEDAVEGIHTYGTGTQPINTLHLIEMLIGWGYGVIYKQISSTAQVEVTVYTYSAAEVDADSFANETYYTLVTALFEIADTYTSGLTYYEYDDTSKTFTVASVEDADAFKKGEYYILKSALYELATEFKSGVTYYTREKQEEPETVTVNGLDTVQDWDFLLDKNAYDVKFITGGIYGIVKVDTKATLLSPAADDLQEYAFNFGILNKLLTVAEKRKDCAVIADLNYYTSTVGKIGDGTILVDNGNTLAADYKVACEYPYQKNNSDTTLLKQLTTGNVTDNYSSRACTIIDNCTMLYNSQTLAVPASFVYLYAYYLASTANSVWSPIAGVQRGVVGDMFTPDISVSKYFMDNYIIEDGAEGEDAEGDDASGVSFNAIVDVRPYGYTIWGDRTLIEQTGERGVQATSYFSIRNLVSDVAKEAYASAIRYTFSTNNDVTWFNFKQRIVTILDRMVSSGILQTYTVKRGTTERRNEMAAIITLAINLPVENFTIWINLENAELTTSDEE